MIELANLYRQYEIIKPEIDDAINRVIKSSRFVGGEEIERFEEHFAGYTGANFCIAVANGTDALEIAIAALGLKDKYIVVPAMSAAPTVEAVVRTGNEPIFCDIDSTMTMDPDEFERIVDEELISAVIPVHLYGAPANMEKIMQIANLNDIAVIEDCAQAHGSKIKNQHVGTFGKLGCFSFYPSKNLGAFGDGGAIITDSCALSVTCRMIRNHGRLNKYDHHMVGRNSRMDTIQAAILDVKLPYLKASVLARRYNAITYDEYLDGICIKPHWRRGDMNYTYHQYPVLVRERDKLLKTLLEHGIKAGVHYPFALPELPPYHHYISGNCLVAKAVAKQEISLPVHDLLTTTDIIRVARVVKEHCKETVF